VTLEDLASRIVAQQKASINYTTVGNTITTTVTPDPTAPNLGVMALDVVNNGTQVIQNVTNWYAYNAQEVFLPNNGGSFTINLGTTQDAVTHIASLPMRGDLLSVTGDGRNLAFSMMGSGQVVVDVANTTVAPIVTGATVVSLVGNQLDLSLTSAGENDVSIQFAPSEVVSSIAFLADTGLSSTDFVTNVAAQTITGSLSAALAAGDVVKVSLDNGVTWLTATAAVGATTFSVAVTLTGSSTLIARVESASGIPSAALTQSYVLDQVPPAETVTIVAMTADSLVAGDFITNNGSAGRTVVGTLSASLAADETLQVSFDGGSSWATPAVAGTAWSVIDAGSHSASWTIQARVIDLAGNTGTLASRAVTLDTTPPPASLAMAAASDSGLSSSDAITKITRPTFAGVTEAGSAIALFDGATQIGAATAGADGTWSITPAANLANGSHTIRARVTDLAGNVAQTTPALVAVIDTIAPVSPSAPDLMAASDTGVSQTDNYTRIATPTFSGTAEVGSTVTLFDGTILIGSGVATSGSWSIASTVALADGTHSVTAKATDLAGNVSIASAALAVKIDTKAPLVSAPDLTASSDSGVSSTDNITRTATPVFTGTAESGSAVQLFDGATQIGTATASAGGGWTITSAVLGDGTHAITTTATDAAGNTSAASAVLSVVIDTSVPAAPLFSGLTVNSNGSATLAGSVEPSTTVTLFDLTTQLGTTIAGGTGVWSFKTGVLADTVHIFTARATDQAGNVGASGGSIQLGSSGADTLISTSGNDLLIGQGGSDTFSFLANSANDVIGDFAATGTRHDVINFHANAVLNSFASVLSHSVQSGSSVVISQDAANTLTLKNVVLGNLNAADFSFS
jgi:large repetitive protein